MSTEVLEIGWVSGALMGLLLWVPFFAARNLGVSIQGMLLSGAARMVVQLALLGLLLSFFFEWNHPVLNAVWLLVMVGAATQAVLKRVELKIPGGMFTILRSISIAAGGTLFFVLAVVVRPEPFWDARYLIPLGGMILGNSMNGTTLATERFARAISSPEGRRLLETRLSLGAVGKEAWAPLAREAWKAAMMPVLNTLATLGLVSIPGMMTGQILGGSSPQTAAVYQALIMLAILASVALSAYLVIHGVADCLLDEDGLIKVEHFKS
jgi:putative ABC transport system permease protein